MKGINIVYRQPTLKDSTEIYALVDRSEPLDLNSRYCYMLICTHFIDTSLVVESGGNVVGLVSGYRNPKRPETLFIWQVAVDGAVRGRGVALTMLKTLLQRESLKDIQTVETTISPSNLPSQKLFRRLASELNAAISERPYFDKTLFGGEAHEDEHLFTIGPIRPFTPDKGV